MEAEFRRILRGDMSISDYCLNLKSLADVLGDIGEAVSDQPLVLNTILGLNEKLAHLAVVLPLMSSFPSFIHVRSLLVLGEIKQRATLQIPQNTALFAASGASKGSNNGAVPAATATTTTIRTEVAVVAIGTITTHVATVALAATAVMAAEMAVGVTVVEAISRLRPNRSGPPSSTRGLGRSKFGRVPQPLPASPQVPSLPHASSPQGLFSVATAAGHVLHCQSTRHFITFMGSIWPCQRFQRLDTAAAWSLVHGHRSNRAHVFGLG